MYALPERLKAEQYAVYPDHLKTANSQNHWIRTQPPGITSGAFLEGPSFDHDGNLLCVDIPNGRILKVTDDRQFHVLCEYDGWPNGLKLHKDGRVFVADHKNGIMILDPQSRKISRFLHEFEGLPFKGVNDLFFSENGDLYFTDQGSTGLHDPAGRVFRWNQNNGLVCVMDKIPSPNGLTTNINETALYVAVTRANAVWRLPLMADGTTTKVGNFIQLSGGTGPDGMAMDEAGTLFVAHPGKGIVWGFEKTGEPIYRIDTPQGNRPTNVAFGGVDNRTLFITESDSSSIVCIKMAVAGRSMFSHGGITT